MTRSLLAFALLAGCTHDGLQPSELPATALAAPSDPSTSATSGWCRYNYTWNGTKGRITHPSNGGCTASVYSPLVVLLHGAGNIEPFGRDSYDYLQKHLARNGFITVSIEYGDASYQDAAVIAQDFLEDFVWRRWNKRVYIDPSSVALIGHSRGGSAVRALAHDLENHPTFDVRSVVTLAPGDAGPALSGDQTEALLSLYGTADGDTSPGATFGFHDRSGDDGPQLDPAWNDQEIYRATKLLEGATHVGYSDLGDVDQQNTLKGYVLAFLAAHHKNDPTWYEDYIRGDAVPGPWTAPVYTSYRDGFYRRTVDDFSDGTLLNPTLGGNALSTGAYAVVVDAPYPHDTWALEMTGAQNSGIVQWSVPAASGDTSAFEWLSLRIAQLDGSPAEDLTVRIRNNGVWSREIALTDHGPIPMPHLFCYGTGFGCQPQSLSTHAAMSTIRVPMSAFGDHDDVEYVRFTFRGDAVGPSFLLDDLEFSEWIFKP
jgi:hypothetical protein